jgi:hypothetical protein
MKWIDDWIVNWLLILKCLYRFAVWGVDLRPLIKAIA